MLRRLVSTLAVAALGLVASPATALTQWGTGADASTSDCPSFCSDFSPLDLDGGTGSLTLNIQLDGAAGDPTSADLETSLFVQVYVFDEASFDSTAAPRPARSRSR
jgi:hypothetical protein